MARAMRLTRDNVPQIFDDPAFYGHKIETIISAALRAAKKDQSLFLIVTGMATERETPEFKFLTEEQFHDTWVFAIREVPNQFTELIRR